MCTVKSTKFVGTKFRGLTSCSWTFEFVDLELCAVLLK